MDAAFPDVNQAAGLCGKGGGKHTACTLPVPSEVPCARHSRSTAHSPVRSRIGGESTVAL